MQHDAHIIGAINAFNSADRSWEHYILTEHCMKSQACV